MFRRLTVLFHSLPLYQKTVLLISALTLFIYGSSLFSIQFLTDRYEQELYRSNARSLSYVSAAVSGRLQSISEMTDSLMGDTVIQENLMALRDSDNARGALYRRNIYQALYSYMFQSPYIKAITITPGDGSHIIMGNSDNLLSYDTGNLEKKSDEGGGRLGWAYPKAVGRDVLCYRQIRQLKYLTLDKLGSLYVIVDIESLIEDTMGEAGYSLADSELILLAGGYRIYPGRSDYEDVYPQIYEKMNTSADRYVITGGVHKSFVIEGRLTTPSLSSPDEGWSFLYFRQYDTIFNYVSAIKLRVFLLSFLFAFVAYWITRQFLAQILGHLEGLIRKINRFGNGESPTSEDDSYDYSQRMDEIGLLHRSFDSMTTSVKVLRDENYEKQLLLRDTTIKMLQQQINPHFLYNTLDTINWMAQREGADDIALMARSLGNLFRACATNDTDLIPLSEELRILENYIQIQRIRFRDRFNYSLQIPEDISRIYVPKLCIQPLAENAFRHSLEYNDGICTLRIEIGLLEEGLCRIEVANTGSEFEENMLWRLENKQIVPQGTGIGLANIHSRLKLLFGEEYGLRFYNKDRMAVVAMLIPHRGDYVKADDC